MTTIEEIEAEVQELANHKFAELFSLIFNKPELRGPEPCEKHGHLLYNYTKLKIRLTKIKRLLRNGERLVLSSIGMKEHTNLYDHYHSMERSADTARTKYYLQECTCKGKVKSI